MTFADGAKAQDKAAAVLRRAGLVGVPDNTRIEQSRRLKRVLVEKVCANKPALCRIQFCVRLERVFHLFSASLEDSEEISVTALEIFEYVTQLLRSSFGIKPKHSLDDMISPRPVGWVQITRFSRRLERFDDDPGWVWTQI